MKLNAIYIICVVYNVQVEANQPLQVHTKHPRCSEKIKIEKGADISDTHLMFKGPCCLSGLSAPVQKPHTIVMLHCGIQSSMSNSNHSV